MNSIQLSVTITRTSSLESSRISPRPFRDTDVHDVQRSSNSGVMTKKKGLPNVIN